MFTEAHLITHCIIHWFISYLLYKREKQAYIQQLQSQADPRRLEYDKMDRTAYGQGIYQVFILRAKYLAIDV